MPRSRVAWALVTIALALPLSGRVSGQGAGSRDARPEPFVVGDRYRLGDGTTPAKRTILVIPPRSYGDTSRSFPVLFVLDGNETAMSAAAAIATLAANGRIPEMIVVAIASADRGLDYTPSLRRTTQLPPGTTAHGGAGAFLRFLRDDVVPLVESRYRVRPMRVLAGHSLGGLFATYAMSTEPRLFGGILTLEPSLWWDGRAVVDSALAVLAADSTVARRLVAVEATCPEGWRPDWARLQRAAGDRATLVSLESESHQTLFYRGIYEGLAKMFGDYLPWMRHDEAHANLASLARQYARLSRDLGYEIPPPLSALLDVADRDANQRRFDEARRVMELAARAYPSSASVSARNRLVEQAAQSAARDRLEESRPVVTFRPSRPADAATLLGEWTLSIREEGGRPIEGVAKFERRGDTLTVVTIARGIAVDGGDYRTAPAFVVRDGNTLRWERENRGGGRVVTTVQQTGPGVLSGTSSSIGGATPPPGFTMPRVAVELRRPAR